jgi:hypothetical protein
MLAEFYEPPSLIRSDEANLINALLVSLNVVDCNLCVKVKTIFEGWGNHMTQGPDRIEMKISKPLIQNKKFG